MKTILATLILFVVTCIAYAIIKLIVFCRTFTIDLTDCFKDFMNEKTDQTI